MYRYRHRRGFSVQTAVAASCKDSHVALTVVLAYSSRHLAAVSSTIASAELWSDAVRRYGLWLKAVRLALSQGMINNAEPEEALVIAICGSLLAKLEINTMVRPICDGLDQKISCIAHYSSNPTFRPKPTETQPCT